MKKFILLVVVLAIPMMLWAGEVVTKGDRSEYMESRTSDPLPRSTQALVVDLPQEAVQTVLRPEFQELQDRYQEQLDGIRAQIGLATPEQVELLEREAMDLKEQLEDERLQVVLTFVRSQGNSEAEARVLAAIEARNTPSRVQRVTVDRDPLTGEARQGGAK
ncbi:MAG: hypothetical protein H6508_00095 [Calditrichaeota bacterium]|nr:hypothetical protein [Calditrichota bacterium]